MRAQDRSAAFETIPRAATELFQPHGSDFDYADTLANGPKTVRRGLPDRRIDITGALIRRIDQGTRRGKIGLDRRLRLGQGVLVTAQALTEARSFSQFVRWAWQNASRLFVGPAPSQWYRLCRSGDLWRHPAPHEPWR